MPSDSEEPSTKKRKIDFEEENPRERRGPKSLYTSISPPPFNRRPRVPPTNTIPSPFHLTTIRDLPLSSNADAVSLKDILGDPLISETWEFNYLHDVDFLMNAFDADVRDSVKVHVVHGFWTTNQRRLDLAAQAKKYGNVQLHAAYMSEPYGTHHSKMLILLRHDSSAQVIIHTANMIPFDWENMTQGLWRSPHLPLLESSKPEASDPKLGSGAKFKIDLLNYLRHYDRNNKRPFTGELVQQLTKHDFSEVRGALVASVPGKQSLETDFTTIWGWPGLKEVLKDVPVPETAATNSEINLQISSIATLDQEGKWLHKVFFPALHRAAKERPKFRIIFPTADEVRRSLNGYASGAAIHTKMETNPQIKQVKSMKPFLCHWAGDGAQHTPNPMTLDAGRKRAAPHIKTYTRFTTPACESIDWMLLTSANLSKQAWGEGPDSTRDVRICSYEIGVLVWPGLWGEDAVMKPTFKTDHPEAGEGEKKIVGARMPYDLPVTGYAKDDAPWLANKTYSELDWTGNAWNL